MPGLTTLFDKLQQGVVENDEVLALAAARADAEDAYAQRLIDIPATFGVKKAGFGRDDGASMRKAYEGIIDEMGEEGRTHRQVADNIRRMVIVPFGKWADEHKQRVNYSHGVLKGKLKDYERETAEVQKSQRRYFNKCRVLEDLKESGGLTGAEVANGVGTGGAVSTGNNGVESKGGLETEAAGEQPPNQAPEQSQQLAHTDTSTENDEPVELGDETYGPDELRALLGAMLDQIPRTKVKIAILGTYDDVSGGDAIVSWIQTNLPNYSTLAAAERFGQDLISEGFLRLVGQVGSRFVNSSVMHYQWRKKAFAIAGREVATSERRDLITPLVGEYLSETIHNYIGANGARPDETPEERLVREVKELDAKYKAAVLRLDDTRCNLEEAIIDHLKFMERCEFDRLKALKAVFLDFIAALSNKVPSIQSSVDKLLLYQETIHPSNDLRYILESYRTGSFSPKVTVYDNYYNSAEGQTFGVDLELRARGDRKRVPAIVPAILSHMDEQYPLMENDDVRLGVWTVSVPLKATHKLRRVLNTGKPFDRRVLTEYEMPVVASVLKLYLIELQDSPVPSQFYDVIKTIYAQHGESEDPAPRLAAIQNTFAQFRVTNIATLDAITTHLTRLMTITNAPEEYKVKLSQEFSQCFLRPRAQSALTIGDRHAAKLVHDLLTYRDQIFSEIKRHSSSSSAKRSNSGLPSRRTSLQNRMDALSLKIRNSQSSGSAPSRFQERVASESKPHSPAPSVESKKSIPPAADPAPEASRRSSGSYESATESPAPATARPVTGNGDQNDPIYVED